METVAQFLVSFGPVALTVMGVAVSISPPKRGGLWPWVWLAAFVVVGLPTSVATFHEMRASDEQLSRIGNAVGIDASGPQTNLVDKIVAKIKAIVSPDWHLDPQDSERIANALDRVPSAMRFTIFVREQLSNNASRMFGDELIKLVKAHHWDVNPAMDPSIDPSFKGVALGISVNYDLMLQEAFKACAKENKIV